MFNGSNLRACMKLRIVQKIRFTLLESGRTKAWCPVWCLGRVPKHRNQWQEVEGLLFSPKKLSVGAYFEILFLGCGFLIHLSNRSPWQELVARSRGLVIQPPKLLVGAYFELSFLGCGFLIHLSNRSDNPRFRAPWKKIRQKYGTQQEPSLFKGHPLSCQYGEALCSMVPS